MIKTKMKGFTLAEVLITLGIIGIVAALTMPQLFNRTRNSHLGAQFASTISTLENAIGVYLYDNNVKSLKLLEDGNLTAPALLDKLDSEKYIKFSPAELKATLTNCEPKFALPDKSVVGICGSEALVDFVDTVETPNMFFLASSSVKNENLIEGLDYFTMYLAADGRIYLPGLDYKTGATCSEEGGEGCSGDIAKNGWKFQY